MEGTRISRAALEGFWPNGDPRSRLLFLPEHGCIYVKNAKAACSTITLWLHRIYTGDLEFLPERSIHKEHGLPRPKNLSWDDAVGALSGEAFRFTFVREPIRRAESAYYDKLLRQGRNRLRRPLQRVLGLPETGEALTVDQFVSALELQDPVEMDPHWRPQHLNVMHGLVEYEFVGRQESFDADLARVREMAGLPHVPVEARNVRGRPTGGPFDGRPDLLRRLGDIYAKDFELYGY
jgi:Sulfotransferase family